MRANDDPPIRETRNLLLLSIAEGSRINKL